MKKKIKKRPILVVMYASYILMTLAGLLLIYRVLKISNVENIILESDSKYEELKNQYDTIINNHISDISNPHNVSKIQVGLGNVLNYGIATKAEAQAGTSNEKYMTPLRVQDFLNANGITTNDNGNVILKIQSTQPAAVSGKTVIWIKA